MTKSYTKTQYLKDCEKARIEFQEACVMNATMYFNKLNSLQSKRAEAIKSEMKEMLK